MDAPATGEGGVAGFQAAAWEYLDALARYENANTAMRSRLRSPSTYCRSSRTRTASKRGRGASMRSPAGS